MVYFRHIMRQTAK